MTAKYWQAGEVLDYTPSDNAVANGEVVSLGTRIGVAGADIAKGATGPLYVEGVFYMDKASGAVTMGAALYYDVANKKITTVASTGESSATAMRFGMAIIPLKVSAMLQRRSSLTVAPIMATRE